MAAILLVLKDSYKRFLEGIFRKTFQLVGTPLRVQFKQGDNPYADAVNKRKKGEGIITMRRRKTARRVELKEKSDKENKKR